MTSIDNAIIFAAGRGSRLGPYTKDLPKTLLTVGDLRIFDRMIVGLDRIGIENIVVVLGYAGSSLKSHALSHSRRLTKNQVNFEFIVNDDLDIGNIYSFWLAKNTMTRDFIMLNSDVIFDYQILDLVKNDKNHSVLAIDDSKTLGLEEMKVKTKDSNIITEITKDLDPRTADGEFIGIMKVSVDVATKVIGKVEQLLSQQKFPLYYEDAFRLVAKEQDCLFACSTKGLPWTEIDTVDDMNYAKSIVMPKIRNLV
jgi:choline kinase